MCAALLLAAACTALLCLCVFRFALALVLSNLVFAWSEQVFAVLSTEEYVRPLRSS